MFASASGFSRPRDALFSIGQHHASVFRKFRHSRTVRHKKFLPRERNDGLLLRRPAIEIFSVLPQTGRQIRKSFFKFPAENCAHPEPTQIFLVHRSVETVEANM